MGNARIADDEVDTLLQMRIVAGVSLTCMRIDQQSFCAVEMVTIVGIG